MMSIPYGEKTEETELDPDICSMDDVEEQTDEKIAHAVWFFIDDSSVDDFLEDLEEITLSVAEEAMEDLIRILEECRARTNKRCYMGHFCREDMEERLREVRQKD